MIHQPGRAAADVVVVGYPSHLHINLLPSAQGRGLGGALIRRLLTALREAGSPGVHLGVGRRNDRAIRFYGHLGFVVLKQQPDALIMGCSTQL